MPKLKKTLNNIKNYNKKAQPYSQPKVLKKKGHSYRFKPTFEEEDKVLFIGEGNFSFSKALADILHRADNFTCTAFDSKETALTKYPEAQENLVALNDMEAEILFQVDATNLIKTPELKGRLYDKIVFNFPHVGLGIKDQEKNVKANQNMILLFLEHASKKLRKGGKIFVSLKTGLPYDLWDIKALGKAAGLALNRSCEFVASDYPGYAHRRTIGFQEFISSSNNEEINKKNPRMYIFSNSD